MKEIIITKPNQYLKETIGLKTELEKTFILLAERLYNIYSQKVWEGQYGSWDEFLMDLKLSSPAASKLMSVYKKYVIEHNIPVSKLVNVRSWEALYAVRSLAIDRSRAMELVEAGAVESDKDMRSKLNGHSQEECEHEWYEVKICKKCGCREKLYTEEK